MRQDGPSRVLSSINRILNMTRPIIINLVLTIVIFLKSGVPGVDAASLAMTVIPEIPSIGSPYSIRCEMILESADDPLSLTIYLNSYTSENSIISTTKNFKDSLPGFASEQIIGAREQQRATASGTFSKQYMSLNYANTLCADNGRLYGCMLMYTLHSKSDSFYLNNSVLINIQANPSLPDQMVVNPNTDAVAQGATINFACSGDVGAKLPIDDVSGQRQFRWFKYIDGIGTEIDQTQVVNEGATKVSNGCTYTRRSTLTLTATPTEVGKPMVVQCHVDEGVISANTPCSNPTTQFCRTSQQINVHYPVQVQIAGQCSGKPVCDVNKGSPLTLKCNIQGNPSPNSVQWLYEGQVVTSGHTYDIGSVNENNAGKYTCNAANVVDGKTRSASASVVVTVGGRVRLTTTTPRPPASASPTSSGASLATIIIPLFVGIILIGAIIFAIVMFRQNSSSHRRSSRRFSSAPVMQAMPVPRQSFTMAKPHYGGQPMFLSAPDPETESTVDSFYVV